MKEKKPNDERLFRDVNHVLNGIIVILVIVLMIPLSIALRSIIPPTETQVSDSPIPASHSNAIKEGLDVDTGLIAEGNYLLVKSTCTACHSSDLILQSKFTKETWVEKIRWMQRTQKLWDLGESEEPILDYLAKYYGPDSVMVSFRKPPLTDIEWYVLKD